MDFEDQVNDQLAAAEEESREDSQEGDLSFLQDAMTANPVPEGLGGYVCLYSASTGSKYVTLEDGETISIADAMARAQIYTVGAFTMWVDGVQVDPSHIVGTGALVDIRGVTKGG
jgi:hypothetical protein